MKVTLQDIAEDTGYSVSTVSRVLNGSNKISSKTKDEILESAEKFDYQTPKVRNAQRSNKLLNVALIATGFHEGEFYVSFYNGLNRAAKENNIRLYLSGIVNPDGEITSIMKEITRNYYDGAILYVPEFKQNDYQQLKSIVPSKFPIVSNALIENPVFSTITFDSYSGGHMAAQHFEEKGHTHVGIIKGSIDRPESRFRYNGFADYISQHPSMQLQWHYNGDFTFDSGHDAFEAYHELDEKPTAIFACNDDMCNGFMEAAITKGYQFPADIAMIGYDDLPVCRHNRPTMSSIQTDYKELGDATMKLLRQKLSNPNQANNMLSFVPVTIIERESS
ncbi:MAG: LacI family DNA-binding transcriptional regulator [Bacteroidota bacterium]